MIIIIIGYHGQISLKLKIKKLKKKEKLKLEFHKERNKSSGSPGYEIRLQKQILQSMIREVTVKGLQVLHFFIIIRDQFSNFTPSKLCLIFQHLSPVGKGIGILFSSPDRARPSHKVTALKPSIRVESRVREQNDFDRIFFVEISRISRTI